MGDSKGNVFAERAVQQVEEMVRVHKLALENAVGKRIPIDHPCIPWLVQHAVDLVNRFLVMKDGTTAYQRVKGAKEYIGDARVWTADPPPGVGQSPRGGHVGTLV